MPRTLFDKVGAFWPLFHAFQLPDESAGLIESPLQYFDESRKFRTTGVAPTSFTESGAPSSFVYTKHSEHQAAHAGADDDFDDVCLDLSFVTLISFDSG